MIRRAYCQSTRPNTCTWPKEETKLACVKANDTDMTVDKIIEAMQRVRGSNGFEFRGCWAAWLLDFSAR